MLISTNPDVPFTNTLKIFHDGVPESPALSMEYPYVVQVQSLQGNYKCDAALITTILALTAAHCVHGTSPEEINIVGGQYDRKQKNLNSQSMNLKQIIVHENFNQVTLEDDIALLVLAGDFQINREIDVTAIPDIIPESEGQTVHCTRMRIRTDTYALAGSMEHHFIFRESADLALTEISAYLIPTQDCLTTKAITNITKKQMCSKEAGSYSCKNDLGGLLACTGTNYINHLCGILSHNDCAKNNMISIFTRVSAYNDWIRAKISELQNRDQTLCQSDSNRCTIKIASNEATLKQCSPGQFLCHTSNNCINRTLQCDNKFDCGFDDHSDEANCDNDRLASSTCKTNEFQCLVSKKCIRDTDVCDGAYDCQEDDIIDISDEENCRDINGCHRSQLGCHKGNECLPRRMRCDGNKDCKDGSDEKNCTFGTPSGCSDKEFQCSVTKKCIPLQFICDEDYDCGKDDVSDEINCRDSHGCHHTQFACATGNKCIPGHLKCDGRRNCGDNSDENNCPTTEPSKICRSNQFQCKVTKVCISALTKVCNGVYDCGFADTSDEENCKAENGCHWTQFACQMGNKCIPKGLLCDGRNDCRDGSDEENCSPLMFSLSNNNCSSTEFQCNITNKCIPRRNVCDGESNCGVTDESDEENCRVFNGCHWSQFACIRGNKCVSKTLECDSDNDCLDGSDEENCGGNTNCGPEELQCPGKAKCYSLRDVCDSANDCSGPHPSDEQNCTVGTHGCYWTQFACRDIRQCIRGTDKCDGSNDCTDGTDEVDCHSPNGCHWTQFTCQNDSKCIDGGYRCDDKKQCSDGSDEENCNDPNRCHWSQFGCHDNSGCMPGHLKCDGKSDCNDGSDEEDCGKRAPQTPITAQIVGYLSIPIVLILLLGCILFGVCLKYRQQQDRLSALEIKLFEMGDEKQLKSDKYAHENAQFIPYNRSYETKWKDFKILDEDKLGEGAYGVVYRGYIGANPNGTIAVKTLKAGVDKTVLLTLLAELKIMIYLGKHENIVGLVGACTEFLREGRAYVLVEFCPMGSLESFLREKTFVGSYLNPNYATKSYTDSTEDTLDAPDTISSKDLVSWAIQIAHGMQYLQDKKVIHGDLATRNVLLYTKAQVKITDFGLSRQLLNYENYVKKSQALLPWRWLALETLKNLVFTHKSDVWSFGVTLWEIFSLGLVPYPGMGWTADFVGYLEQHQRLSKPKYANDEIYSIMARCWEPEPDVRPDFKQLEELLQEI